MRISILFFAFFLSGCGLDPLLFSTTDGEPLPAYPDAQPNVLAGFVTELPGATVSLVGSTGLAVAPPVTADSEGGFAFQLPGNTAYSGLRVIAELGSEQRIGLAPEVTKQASVLDGIRTVPMNLVPAMENLNAASTTVALILLQRSGGTPLGSDVLSAAGSALEEGLDNVPAIQTVHSMVEALFAEAALRTAPEPRPFRLDWAGTTGESPLNEAFLKDGVDYEGTGELQTTSTRFDEALAQAAAALEFDSCVPEDFIRLVFMVRLEEGLPDGNCSPLDPYLWASDEGGKAVFFTGGIHVETPRCDAGTDEDCIPGDVADAAHIELGAWEPNVVPMFDDGTNGDPVAGDGVWTRSFVVPWIPGAATNGNRGVRIGYKYTFGQPGSLWTDTEEWPGNQRILEVDDLDGDQLVIRYDYFGDEATNKDKKNSLSFANGGCGTNQWPEKESDTCHSDVFENGKAFQDPCDGSEPPAQPAVAPVSCSELGN